MKKFLRRLLFVAGLAAALYPWVRVSEATTTIGAMVRGVSGTSVQAQLDAATSGGTIHLGPGTYTGDLTISNAGVILEGDGTNATTLSGSILVSAGDVTIRDLTVRGAGEAYGIKLYRAAGGGVPRCTLRRLFVGAADVGGRGTVGPAGHGLYLDGAILTRIECCTFAFNGKAGAYARSTSGTWSTNANTFHDCTFNLNGSYGAEFVGGSMLGNQLYGGNAEDNDSGGVYVKENTGFIIRGVDFENTVTGNTNIVQIDSSNPAVVEDCNFAGGGISTRAFSGSGDQATEIRRNRFSGFPSKAPLAIFDPTSTNCLYSGNVFADPDSLSFLLNKGAVPLAGQPWGEPWRSPLTTFTGDLWLPDSTSGGGSGLGAPWVSNGTVARVTPTYGDSGSWMRRTSFSSGGASQELGIKMTNAAEFQFFRNTVHKAGGYYFSATFRIETWGGNTARLFVGLASSAAGSVVSAVDSATVGNDIIGLYHDANDVNKFRIVSKAAGAVTKDLIQIPSVTTESFPATGKTFRFEMQYFPYTATTYCLLTRMEDGKVVGFQNVGGGPTNSVMVAPQVEINNGTSGACSLGIINVYVTR